nr:MAG TPA: hypothetical protein [Caudoviricetes sp.]
MAVVRADTTIGTSTERERNCFSSILYTSSKCSPS